MNDYEDEVRAPERQEPRFSYEVPFYRALAEPMMIGTVPFSLAIIDATMAVLLIYMGEWLACAIVCIPLWFVFKKLGKWDPHFFFVLVRQVLLPSVFHVR